MVDRETLKSIAKRIKDSLILLKGNPNQYLLSTAIAEYSLTDAETKAVAYYTLSTDAGDHWYDQHLNGSAKGNMVHELYIVGDNGRVLKAEIAAVIRLPTSEETSGTTYWEFTLRSGQKVVLEDTPDDNGSHNIAHQVRCLDE